MAKVMSGQIPVKIDKNHLASSARAAKEGRGPAPVHLWDPPFCGMMDMKIARDGTWYHEGSPINRANMVRLFASILRKEGDDYFLVTPVEKVGITVQDAPFVAINFDISDQNGDQVLTFETNVGEYAEAGPDHPIRVTRDIETGEPSPYVLIRNNLEALIDRKSFYRLVEIGEDFNVEGTLWFGIRSNGAFFPLIKSADLT